MFWRRSRKADDASARSSASPNDGDDLMKLQRQFGIKTISDKDVEADFLKLLGSTSGATGGGSGFGLSPRTEHALFGDGGHESDEEAKILRQLNLSGTVDSIDADALSGEDDDDDDEETKLAKRELQGVLGEVHREAKHNAVKNDPLVAVTPPPVASEPLRERIHSMKLRAVTLKREGNVQEALVVFRQVRTLEAQLTTGINAGTTTVQTATVQTTQVVIPNESVAVSTHQQRTVQSIDVVPNDDAVESDIDVTDEDMENPEYLAQLAVLGMPVAKPSPPPTPVETVESLERAIRDAKEKAVQLKRSDRIADALAEMRKIKELEAKLTALRPQSGTTVAPPTPVSSAAPPIERPVLVVPPLPEATNDSDVEVTDEDMNDPAFAAELQKMGFDLGGTSDTEPTEEKENDTMAPLASPIENHPPAPDKVRHLPKRYSSIDDHDLIDEFEEDEDEDGEEKASIPEENEDRELPSPTVSAKEIVEEEPTSIAAHGPPVSFVSTPQENENIQEPSSGLSIEELQQQLQKTKLTAIQLKREGNIQPALDMMRRMKQIENLIEMKRHHVPAIPVLSPEEFERKRKFSELEALLVQFANDATREAKDQLSINRTKAAEWLARRKEYSAMLVVLREKRNIVGQDPPTYRMEKLTEQVEVEHTDIPLDEVHLQIHSVNDLNQAAGKEIFVKFNLSFPSSAPHEGKTGVLRISSAAPFSGRITTENVFRVKVQRGRGTQRLFEIKKASFEVWRPGSLLRNPEFVARGYQELAPLLTSTEIKTHIVFVGPNRKPIGGDVEISLRLRTPLREKEYKTIVTEVVRVGEYPSPQVPVVIHQSISRPTAHFEPGPPMATQKHRPHSQSDVPTMVTSVPAQPGPLPHTMSAPTLQATMQPAKIDPRILEDPHDLDLIVSYDVINDEIERIESALPNLQGEMAAEYSDRLDSLGLKKQLLEIEMQTGKLTLDMYVVRLKQRILDDRAIIKQLVKSGRKPDAARVLHRVKLMEKELKGTEDQDDATDQ